MYATLSRFTNLSIKPLAVISIFSLGIGVAHGADEAIKKILIKSAKDAGFTPAADLYQNPDENLANFGKVFFSSNKGLSLNGNISCKTCHLNERGSADGIPNAAAIGGKGESVERLLSGAKQLPRNTLAFWGRGAKEFKTFFWDGKIDYAGVQPKTQFGSKIPSSDPLITAVHLPVVEIREMLDEDAFIANNKVENVENSRKVYRRIAKKLVAVEPDASLGIAKVLGKSVDQLEFLDFARAIAAFIRSEFRLRPTKFEKFVNGGGSLTNEELTGGIIFYGKGACVTCHNGPHFSDFKFYAVPFPQLGFGKNGFGVDYGRYNVSFQPKDLYKFRTPPLYNVEKTAPYGHSGSVATIEEAIYSHFDPLRNIDLAKLSPLDRHELTKRLSANDSSLRVNFLTEQEVKLVASFLKTLSF